MKWVIRSAFGVLVTVAALAGAAPAEAQRHHGGHHGGPSVSFGFGYYDPYPSYYQRPYYYHSPPVYVAPPPVYYAPPPAYYAPPPSAVYAPTAPLAGPRAESGANCREYQATVNVGGEPQEMTGTACLQADGTWRIVR